MPWKVRRQPSAAGPDVPFTVRGKVGRVEDPPPPAFHKGYVLANRPVVVSGVMDPWKALRDWSWDYLAGVVGDHAGEVIVSGNGLYPDYVSQPPPMVRVQMSFAEFVARAVPGAAPAGAPPAPVLAPGETYYIYGKSYLFDAFPRLRDDVAKPACLGAAEVSTLSTWISSAGCVTPLHYDLPNSLLCQVRGAKRVFLFAPEQHDLLYLRGSHFPGFDNFERQSRVDIHHPDFAAFPEFRRASALDCTLREGDSLFIPSNWLHEVETLETSISVGFTFAGGTNTSELAALSETFKRLSGGTGQAPVGGMDLFRRSGDGAPPAAAPDLTAYDPARLEELMASPAVQRLLQDPSLLAALARLMAGGQRNS
jgi:cupin-like protein